MVGADDEFVNMKQYKTTVQCYNHCNKNILIIYCTKICLRIQVGKIEMNKYSLYIEELH